MGAMDPRAVVELGKRRTYAFVRCGDWSEFRMAKKAIDRLGSTQEAQLGMGYGRARVLLAAGARARLPIRRAEG